MHEELFPKQTTVSFFNGFMIDFYSIYFGFHICRPFNEDFSDGTQLLLPFANDK